MENTNQELLHEVSILQNKLNKARSEAEYLAKALLNPDKPKEALRKACEILGLEDTQS